MRLTDIMTPCAIAAQASQSLAEARSLMERHHVDYLPVLSGRTLRGILCAEDLYGLSRRALEGAPLALCLDDVLATRRARDVLVVSPLATLEEARHLLSSAPPHGCLVVEEGDGEVLGTVTASHFVELDTRQLEGGRETPRSMIGDWVTEVVGEQSRRAWLFDLSEGGARLRTDASSLHEGHRVSMTWALPDGDEKALCATGWIIRRASGDDTHAVSFSVLAEADRQRIANFVAQSFLQRCRGLMT
jgi:CBS domain-containing protein